MKRKQPLILSDQSPFKESIERIITTNTASDSGIILNEEVVITRKRQYINNNLPWIRLTQDKEVLRDLSPWAWFIIGHIALNITWQQEIIKLSNKEVGLDRRMYKRSMLELLAARVIAPSRRKGEYWLNIGIMLMGNVEKPDNPLKE